MVRHRTMDWISERAERELINAMGEDGNRSVEPQRSAGGNDDRLRTSPTMMIQYCIRTVTSIALISIEARSEQRNVAFLLSRAGPECPYGIFVPSGLRCIRAAAFVIIPFRSLH